jgi:NADPH:quinone reductase-like Zn-dependent oxidoreductase
MAVKMPESMSFIDAAAIWMQYSTAYNSMVNVAQLQKGEYVLLEVDPKNWTASGAAKVRNRR